MSALYMCQLVKEAGIPAGVFNTVPGLGATTGDAISRHMDIDKVQSGYTLAANSCNGATVQRN
jgi:acyl-CoA reductase-like NAD-dependent aldehyde dehydrogenase